MIERTGGYKPSSGELQARVAEKEAQGKTRQPNLDAILSANTHKKTDHAMLEVIRQNIKETYGQRKSVPRLITPRGVATTPEEVDLVFAK